jgi:hypothetical protein
MFNRSRKTFSAALFVSALGLCSSAYAAERCVVLEEFTATWCQPCIPMGTAISGLLNNLGDDDLALMQLHISDNFANSYTNSRDSFYNVTAIPTVIVEGQTKVVGWSTGNWTIINNAVNQRLATPTDCTIESWATQVDPNTFQVEGRVTLEPGGTPRNVNLYVVQVLDYYPSGSHHRNCARQAFVSNSVSLALGEPVEYSFTMHLASPDETNIQNVKVITLLQKPSSFPAETYQSHVMKYPFPTGGVEGDLDGDGCVGQADLGILLAAYGQNDGGDLDGDGQTGQADLGILLANYGQGCP